MSAARFWRERSAAERRILVLVALVAGVAALAAFVWLPLERKHARLASELPGLRASVATLERQADEVRRLRALPARSAAPAEPLASLVTAAGGTSLPGAQFSVLDGRTLAITASDVAFGALLEWIAAAQASQGLRVQSAHIEALALPGRVRAEVRLARP